MATNPIIPSKTPAPGWIGGFSTSNPAFAYPDPDLTSLPMLDNMANIPLLQRQLDVLWPEFSWETIVGNPQSRCYQMFAPDISRAGYDAAGRVYSIICPQQGAYSPNLGDLNIEVTVNAQRGWVNEQAGDLDADLVAADMTVTGKIWFGPSAKTKRIYKLLEMILKVEKLPFPLDKANAIQVTLHRVGDPSQPIIQVRSGINPDFPNPPFALHAEEAWAVANVSVQIGPILSRHNPMVDDFNAMVMEIFNLASGNLLKVGNVLTWNVWLDAPTLVDQAEWKAHAETWRHSIDTGHVTPDGAGHRARYFDECPFEPGEQIVEQELDLIRAWLKKHVGWLADLAA
ncbi:hypothetical protein [Sphingosinicella sp. BN140058]|uniref:hypothetical protein n=1 Tax=Sphingosinicella sp. BN140058 TaxID=1892855 RepID=UPI00101090D6|nr:hypothetical protein [Sphingosinicella sp. BN140058]QAY75449.1 hypothetical protein ETR14_02085 [Sphingosinicella sp. BN140058]